MATTIVFKGIVDRLRPDDMSLPPAAQDGDQNGAIPKGVMTAGEHLRAVSSDDPRIFREMPYDPVTDVDEYTDFGLGSKRV